MDKLTFQRPKKKGSKQGEYPVIRVSGAAYEIISGISAETGKSVSYIASQMIEFAEKYTAIEDEN